MKTYETELPAGYREAYTIDAKDNKIGLKLNLAALVITAAIAVPLYFIIRPALERRLSSMLLFVGGLLLYLVLHELTHGAAYKLLTGQKLTFGMSLTVAYCGMPNIYVYRRTALISLLAPFVVFTIVFGALTILLQNPMDKMLAALMLAIHAGGCAGDLYDTWLYLTRFRDPATLMRDTGPKQTFYTK